MNDPIAWYHEDDNFESISLHRNTLPHDAIPLYTHPMRELSDEKIVETLDKIVGNIQHIEVLHMIIFARAIIKASRGEK